MRASMMLGMALGLTAALASSMGCSSSGGSTGGGGSTTGTGGSGGGTSSSSSGGTSSSTTSSTGSTTSSSSSSGTGGAPAYTCSECQDPTAGAGAKGKECKAEGDACFQNKNCVQLFNCVYFGSVDKDGNPIGGCTNSAEGACCTFDCYAALKDVVVDDAAAQQAINAYEAMDQCVTCDVCKSICDGAAEYCTKYAAGPDSCP
ncbi:Xanthine/uracil/thiamine/ascorbate permease family protein [Minicystis rosea]|nr:Xanthine/uracil/thiamine/ascorbate permease family protein [Minicystis rosea]